jgi:hypothetical protein
MAMSTSMFDIAKSKRLCMASTGSTPGGNHATARQHVEGLAPGTVPGPIRDDPDGQRSSRVQNGHVIEGLQ